MSRGVSGAGAAEQLAGLFGAASDPLSPRPAPADGSGEGSGLGIPPPPCSEALTREVSEAGKRLLKMGITQAYLSHSMKSSELLNEKFDAFKAAFQSVLSVNPLSGPSTTQRAQIRATTQHFKNLDAQEAAETSWGSVQSVMRHPAYATFAKTLTEWGYFKGLEPGDPARAPRDEEACAVFREKFEPIEKKAQEDRAERQKKKREEEAKVAQRAKQSDPSSVAVPKRRPSKAAPPSGFRPPTKVQRERALNDLHGKVPAGLGPVFAPDPQHFTPLGRAAPDEWLWWHKEKGQSVAEYESRKKPLPTAKRPALHIVPVGDFPPERSPDLGALCNFAAAHFGCPVELAKPIDIEFGKGVAKDLRINDGVRQLRVRDIMAALKKRKQGAAKAAFAQLAVTMYDLYPSESWNFVFGQASLTEGVGVFSFSRYDPRKGGEPVDPFELRQVDGPEIGVAGLDGDGLGPLSAEARAHMTRRSATVMAHEGGHVLGMKHCIHYNCLMNGANSEEEGAARPVALCPVCLRKLHTAIRFDPLERYQRLVDAWKVIGYAPAVNWHAARLAHVREALTAAASTASAARDAAAKRVAKKKATTAGR